MLLLFVTSSIEGKRWGLLHSDIFRVLFRLGLLEKYLISHDGRSFEHRRRHLSSPRQIQRKNDLVEREHERTLGWEKGDSRTKEGGGHEVWESKEERRRRETFLKRNLG